MSTPRRSGRAVSAQRSGRSRSSDSRCAARSSRSPSAAAGRYPCADGTPRPRSSAPSSPVPSSCVASRRAAAAAARCHACRRRAPAALVEAVLGRQPVERRQLTLDFEPATATRWELLIDGAAFFPRHARGHRGRHVRRPHPDLRLQGRRDRRPVPRPPGRARSREGVGVRIITEAAFSQPGRRLEGVLRLARRRRRPGRREPGRVPRPRRARSASGEIDWRFDDLGHFDHRKVVVIDGRVGYVGGPGHRGPLRDRDATT